MKAAFIDTSPRHVDQRGPLLNDALQFAGKIDASIAKFTEHPEAQNLAQRASELDRKNEKFQDEFTRPSLKEMAN